MVMKLRKKICVCENAPWELKKAWKLSTATWYMEWPMRIDYFRIIVIPITMIVLK